MNQELRDLGAVRLVFGQGNQDLDGPPDPVGVPRDRQRRLSAVDRPRHLLPERFGAFARQGCEKADRCSTIDTIAEDFGQGADRLSRARSVEALDFDFGSHGHAGSWKATYSALAASAGTLSSQAPSHEQWLEACSCVRPTGSFRPACSAPPVPCGTRTRHRHWPVRSCP